MRTSASTCLKHVLLILLVVGVGCLVVLQQVRTPRATAQASQEVAELRELPASGDSLPPGMKGMEKEKAPPAPKERPGMKELEEIIKQQPGGPERLEKAKRGEKPTKAPGQQSRLGKLGASLAEVNPFRVHVANAGATFTLTLKPTLNPTTGAHVGMSNPPTGYLVSWGAWMDSASPNNTRFVVQPWPTFYIDPVTIVGIQNPLISLGVTVPAAGYYIVSLNGYSAARVRMYHSENARWVFLHDFPALSTQANRTCADLLYLQAGQHQFGWVVSTGPPTWHFNVYSATVDSYP